VKRICRQNKRKLAIMGMTEIHELKPEQTMVGEAKIYVDGKLIGTYTPNADLRLRADQISQIEKELGLA